MANDVLAGGWAKFLGRNRKRFDMFFDKMLDGFAYHKIVVDKSGKPVDYVFLEVNHAFEKMTGLQRKQIIGKRVTEAISGFEKDVADWIGVYGRVALTGKPVQFETYSEPVDKWLRIEAYCPAKGYFVALYEDITERKKAEEALRESEQRYSSLFNSIPEGFCLVEIVRDKNNVAVDLRFLEINDAYAKLVDRSREQIIGKTTREAFGAVEDYWYQLYDKVSKTGEFVHYENYVQLHDRYYEVYAWRADAANHVAILNSNVTERKKQEREIENLAKFPSENPNPIFRIDGNGIILYSNQAGASFLAAWNSKVGECAPKNIIQAVANALASNNRFEIEETFETKTFLLSFAPVIVEGYVNIYAIDITERKKGEAQILEQLHMLDLAHVIVKNMKDEIIFWNAGAQKLYGFSKEEALGKIPRDLLKTKFPIPLEQIKKELLFTGKWEGELVHQKANGSQIFVASHWVLHKDNNDKPVAIIEVNNDITERKKAEEKTQRQNAIMMGVNKIFQEALSGCTEEELGQLCLDVAEEVTQSKFGFIDEIKDKGLEYIAISNPGWNACKTIVLNGKRQHGTFKIHGIYGRVISDRKGFFTNNPASHPDSIGLPAGHPPLNAFLGVPLKLEGKTIGMIAVGNREGGYTNDQLGSLEALAPAIVEAFLRKRAEQALRKLNRHLKAVSNSNQALMHATDESKFTQEVCNIIINDCGYALVWVGFAEHDQNKTVRPVAFAGFDKGYIDALRVTWDGKSERGRGPTGTVIRTGKPYICKNMQIDPNFEPWRPEAQKRGYTASLVLPLTSIEGDTFGALNIYSKESDPFTDEETKLLTELANDFSYGIGMLRLRKKREQDEETLRKQASLIDLSPDAIIVRTFDGVITFWSKGAEKLYGWTKDEAIGQVTHTLLRTEFPIPLREIEKKQKLEGKWSGELVHTTKNGDKVVVQSYMLGKFGADGKIVEILESNVEITERILMQSKLEDSAVRIEEYANQMEQLANQRAEQLKSAERLAAIGATAGMVGHDIRNPLQAITSDVYLAKIELASTPESDEKKNAIESLQEIEKNVDYINKIVSDLQDYTRTLKPVARETDLQKLMDELLTKTRIPENVTVQVKVQKEAGSVMADPDILKRVFGNLVINAVQAMPKGGKLTLHAYKEADDSIITVADTGVGIPEEAKDKIFTPLFTTKSKGQGFGLPVVKRMTESLGGTVTFESQQDKGTKFIIRLPPQNVKR